MTTGELLASAWHWEPTVVIGCLGLLVGYGAALRWRIPPRGALFALGVVVLLLALVSPIDGIGDTYLLSVHMLQHVLLLLAVPPLLILGIPRRLAEQVLTWAPARRLEQVLAQPALAWVLAFSTLWIWHLPALYNAALANEGLHITEHLAFLVTATIFWWPLLTPITEHRLDMVPATLYLVAATFAGNLLGIIITFAPTGLYPAYLDPPNPQGTLTLIREGWGISARQDQQYAGVLMWAFGNLPYLAALLATFARWMAEPDDDLLPVPAGVPLREEV